MFVLDSSVSQTEEEFKKQLEFITKFVDDIEIGYEAFNVAVITYSLEAVVEIYPTSSMTNDALKVSVFNCIALRINTHIYDHIM